MHMMVVMAVLMTVMMMAVVTSVMVAMIHGHHAVGVVAMSRVTRARLILDTMVFQVARATRIVALRKCSGTNGQCGGKQ